MYFNLLEGETVTETVDGAQNATASAKGIDWSAVLKTVVDWFTHTGIKLLIAIILMIVTFAIINEIGRAHF